MSFNLPTLTNILLPRFISTLISDLGLDAPESLAREIPWVIPVSYSGPNLLGLDTKTTSMLHGCCDPESCVFPSFMQDRQVHFLNRRALAVVMQHYYASSVLQCYRNNHSTAIGGLPL